jgi:hypothetical protein
MDDEDIIQRLVIKPQNRSPFKYGSREVGNDDAIEVINQLIAVVDTLIEIEDDSEDWNKRKAWLNSVLNSMIHGLDAYAPKGQQPKYKWQGNVERLQVSFSGKTRQGLRYNYGKKLGKDVDGKWIPEQKVIDNLELAYAISVHKSQGSEFDYVYIVIPHKESHCYVQGRRVLLGACRKNK